MKNWWIILPITLAVLTYPVEAQSLDRRADMESAPALQEVAKLLKQDARLKLFVVGHTDNVGSLAANLDLSRQRAAAVVQALAAQYGVPADRMQAFGAGPYAPVSSNESEDGRTRNRRVELVKQ